MRYGVPYKGSKNSIAEWIVDSLPRADTFVDLFCGGCAVTHRAFFMLRHWEESVGARKELEVALCNHYKILAQK